MIIFIAKDKFKTENIEYESSPFIFEKLVKKIKIDGYLSVIQPTPEDVRIYYKIGTVETEEVIKHLISKDNGESFETDPLIYDKNKSYCHNLVVFIDENPRVAKENKIKALGGRHGISKIYQQKSGNNPVIDGKKYDKNICKYFIDKKRWSPENTIIYSPFEKCDNYANGLHCFTIINNQLKHINNDLPIVSGFHEGRHDGFYGSVGVKKIKDINESLNNGLSCFDGAQNIVYCPIKNEYILYARANIMQGVRSIQFATSKDLVSWSRFELIKVNNREEYILNDNYYYCNFFKSGNIFIGILPYIRKTKDINNWTFGGGHHSFYGDGKFLLMTSLDGKNWDIIGKVLNYNYETDYIAIGKPVISKDKKKHYFYVNQKGNLNLYSIPKNRLGCIKSKTGVVGTIILENVKPISDNVSINCKIESGGYIKIYDKEFGCDSEVDPIINITGPCDELNKVLTGIKSQSSWVIKVFKAKLYSLEGVE